MWCLSLEHSWTQAIERKKQKVQEEQDQNFTKQALQKRKGRSLL